MTVSETIAMKVARLPPDRQKEVLDFVDALVNRLERKRSPLWDPEGLLAGQLSELTLEDFIAARRETWRNFLRDFEP